MDGIDHEPAHSGLIFSINLKRKLSSVLELLKNRNLAIIFITWILFALAGPLFWQFESDYAKRLGASPEIIGMMNSVFTLINMLVQIPGGYLADKKGRKKLVVWGTFLVGFPNLMRALSKDWRSYFLATALTVAVGNMYNPALAAIYQDSLPLDSRAFGSSVINGISWAIPSTISSLLGGYLYERYGLSGLRAALVVNALVYFVNGALRSRMVETLQVKKTQGMSFRETISSLRRIFSWAYGSVRVLLTLDILFGVITGISGAFRLLYALYVIGVSRVEWGMLGGVYNMLYLPLSLYAGMMSDRKGRVRQMRLTPILWAISNLLFVTANDFEMVLLSWILGVIGDAFWRPGFSAMWIDIIPRKRRARIFSIRTIVGGVSSSISYSIGGFLYAKNEVFPFIVVILIQFLMIPLLLYLKEPETREI